MPHAFSEWKTCLKQCYTKQVSFTPNAIFEDATTAVRKRASLIHYNNSKLFMEVVNEGDKLNIEAQAYSVISVNIEGITGYNLSQPVELTLPLSQVLDNLLYFILISMLIIWTTEEMALDIIL